MTSVGSFCNTMQIRTEAFGGWEGTDLTAIIVRGHEPSTQRFSDPYVEGSVSYMSVARI